MNRPRVIDQIMPAFEYADALGNEAQRIRTGGTGATTHRYMH